MLRDLPETEAPQTHYSLKNYEWMLASSRIERWLRFKTNGTKRSELMKMERFLTWTGAELGVKDPDAFLEWAKTRPETIEVEDAIEKFAETQSAASRPMMVSVPRSFLKRNGFSNLPSTTMPRVAKAHHEGFKREELQSFLGFLDDKLQKLYVLFAKDSGLRASDILSIRYRHLKKDLEAGNEFVHVRLEPAYYSRRKASGMTFIGPNTVKLLKQLIEEKRVEQKAESRIFPYAYPTIADDVRLARNKAGLDPSLQPSHGLRKFFMNSLDRVGMDVHRKMQLEGHSQGVRAHYTDHDVEELRKLYQQAYQFLDLSEAAAVGTKFSELEKQLTTLTVENKKLKEDNALFEVLKPHLPTLLEMLTEKERQKKK